MSKTPLHLGILSKTLLIVCTLLVVLTVSFLTFSYSLVNNRFKTLELTEARLNLERAINQFGNVQKKLEILVSDWASWDETHAFVQDLNKDYINIHLTEKKFHPLGIHFVLFFNTSNDLVYSRFYDLSRAQVTAPDVSVIHSLGALHNLFQFSSTQEMKSGLLRTASLPAIIASAPIVTSTYEGPVRGTLVFGRYLDKVTLEQIASHTRLDLQALQKTSDYEKLFDQGTRYQFSLSPTPLPVAFQIKDEEHLRALVRLNDFNNKPVVILSLSLRRALFQQGMAIWKNHSRFLVALGGICILALVVLLNRIILHRLTRLNREVAHIAEAGESSLRVTVTAADEIGSLAEGINDMLASLQTLQAIQAKNEEHLADIINSINCGIMLVDTKTRQILSINRAGAEMAGRSVQEIIGQSCHRFICPKELYCCPVLDEGEQVNLSERVILLADGSTLPVLKSVNRIERGEQTLLVESFIDITNIKTMQAELLASEAKYRRFFEQDLTGNFISSKEGFLIDCNPAFAQMLGYDTPDSIIGLPMTTFYSDPNKRQILLQRVMEKETLERYEGVMQHKNGQEVYIICNLIGEFDEQHQLQFIRGYIFDDTKRVLLEKKIRQTQKLEAIGTMAGGIAHDFNNILAGIIGYTEIILRDLPPDEHEKSYHNLKNILTAGERARSLIEKMLTFSRQSESTRQPVSLTRTLDDVLQLIRVSLPATISITSEISGHPVVQADPIQMHQVFMNLCTNAGHAMKENGGTLTISLKTVHLDSDFTSRHPELTSGEYAQITLSDTGKGIDEQILERIFDPFFTTKQKGEGTGLGLSMVHGIVKAMYGLITVDSQIGLGTTFTLYLPAIQEKEMQPTVEQQTIPIGHEHVVYIDDEGFLVDIGTEILRGLGYQVTGFTDSQEALTYLQENASSVDLVVSDMAMPNLTGLELAKQLQSQNAAPPIIICTGHNEGMSKEDFSTYGVEDLLLKPVTVNQLARVIRDLLDKKPSSPK
nr:CHASE4 domain-containing protein [uncultured Desulfobulbus sp.]